MQTNPAVEQNKNIK